MYFRGYSLWYYGILHWLNANAKCLVKMQMPFGYLQIDRNMYIIRSGLNIPVE